MVGWLRCFCLRFWGRILGFYAALGFLTVSSIHKFALVTGLNSQDLDSSLHSFAFAICHFGVNHRQFSQAISKQLG